MASTINTYTPEEFASCYVLRGYGKKKAALKWCEQNDLQTLTEDAFEQCWHDLNRTPIRLHTMERAVLHRRFRLEEFEYGGKDD